MGKYALLRLVKGLGPQLKREYLRQILAEPQDRTPVDLRAGTRNIPAGGAASHEEMPRAKSPAIQPECPVKFVRPQVPVPLPRLQQLYVNACKH